jgi:hypothetical protein
MIEQAFQQKSMQSMQSMQEEQPEPEPQEELVEAERPPMELFQSIFGDEES